MNDLPTHKDGLCAWRKRGSHFNLSFRGIFLPAFEAQSAPGHILARHDIFAERVTPDACLEIHLRAHMLAPVFDSRCCLQCWRWIRWRDRKSTRLNSSHSQISYAVFCLKQK